MTQHTEEAWFDDSSRRLCRRRCTLASSSGDDVGVAWDVGDADEGGLPKKKERVTVIVVAAGRRTGPSPRRRRGPAP